MWTNQFKIAVRRLLATRQLSAIRILGLAVSLCACLLVLMFVFDQLNKDRFLELDDTYLVHTDFRAEYDGDHRLYATSPWTLADHLRDSHASIVDVTRLVPFSTTADNAGVKLALTGFATEPTFLRLFGFRLDAGDSDLVLTTPDHLVLSSQAAERLFGAADPMGKTLHLDGRDMTVAGVLAPLPGASRFHFDALRLISEEETSGAQAQAWQDGIHEGYHTFIKLRPGTDASELDALLASVAQQHYPSGSLGDLQAVTMTHMDDLDFGPILQYQMFATLPAVVLYFLAVLGGLILLVASFNYTSLTISGSRRWAGEIGLRKSIGAGRAQIAGQILCEAVVMALIALVLAALLVGPLVASFNRLEIIQLARMTISIGMWDDARILPSFVLLAIGVGCLAGLYPAIRLSQTTPIDALRGRGAGTDRQRLLLRKPLAIVQCALSLLVVITSGTLYSQFRYMTSADFGFSSENVLNVRLQDVPYSVVRQKLAMHTDVERISAVSIPPMSSGNEPLMVRRPGDETSHRVNRLAVDEEFVANLDLQVIAGVVPRASADGGTADALVSRAAVEQLGYDSPQAAVGQSLSAEDGSQVRIVGVIEDIYTTSILSDVEALLLTLDVGRVGFANVRVRPGQLAAVQTYVEDVWPTLGSAHDAHVIEYDRQINESGTTVIFRSFLHVIGALAAFTVAIALLGLLGMGIFEAERRVREVGLRKVLGASTPSVVTLICRDFVLPVALAALVATPVAYLINEMLLQNLPLRTGQSAFVFVGSIVGAFLLALLTIGSQALRTASRNPVETLRQE